MSGDTIKVGDEILVDGDAYGVGLEWARVERIAPGSAAVYPYKVTLSNGAPGQYGAWEILERRRPAPAAADGLGDLIFQAVAGYLAHRGWYRDGQDAGVWIKQAGPGRLAVGIDEALAVQFLEDGVDLLQVARVRRVPNLPRVRGAIRDVLAVFFARPLTRDELLAVGELHRVDADELGRSGVRLPEAVAT